MRSSGRPLIYAFVGIEWRNRTIFPRHRENIEMCIQVIDIDHITDIKRTYRRQGLHKKGNQLRDISSRSILLLFRSCSSIISLSAADIGADLFPFTALSPPSEEADCEAAAVLNTFGRFNGFALRGFATAFNGFILNPRVGAVVAAGGVGLVDRDRTTFSVFSSRRKPSSIAVVDGPGSLVVSAAARSICSAISRRSLCSSEMVARSFFCEASYN